MDVGLSFAGEINWKAHTACSAYLENVKKAAPIPSKTLLSFFNKKATLSPLDAPRSSSTLDPLRLSSSLTPGVPPSLPIAQHFHESVARLSVTPPPTPILRLSLLDRLKAVIDSFLAEVPYGADSDDLAIFAGSPRTYIQQDDEAWENIDPLMNQVIRYGATPKIISPPSCSSTSLSLHPLSSSPIPHTRLLF